MAELTEVTDATFEQEVLSSDRPVLVDFYGDHCPACRQIAPILEGLAGERPDAVKIVKVHAVDNARTAAMYHVSAMPTVLLFAQGNVRGQLVGARPKSAFIDLIESAA